MRLSAGPTLLLAAVLCLAAPAQSAVLNATALVSCDSAACNASWPNASLPAECDACGASATKRSQPNWPSFVLFMLLLLASPFLVRLAFRYAVRAFCHVHDVPRRHPFWVEVEPEADDEAPPSPSKSVKVAPLYEETPVLRFEPATTPRDLPAPTDAWSPSTTTTTRDRPAPAAEPELSTTTPRDRPTPAAEPELSTTTTRDRPAPAAEPEPATTSTARQQDLAKKYAKKMIKQRYEKKFAELRRKQAAVEERLRRERASRDKCSQALDTVNDIAQEAKSGAVAPGRVSMLEMLGIGEGEAKEAADAAGGDAQKAELSLLAGLFKPKPRAEPKSPEAEAPRSRTPKDRYRA